jgi:hypothetical protein
MKIISAIGDRQMFPVHTKQTLSTLRESTWPV